MATFTRVSPFSVGRAPSKTRLDKVFDNTLWLASQGSRKFGVVNGLLRTAAGNTASLTQLRLERADEIVFSDGRRMELTAPLTAAITTSGAGGLDAGAEQINRWYQPYVIAKDDGTQALILRMMAAFAIDQAQTSGPGSMGMNWASNQVHLAQSFVPTVNARMPFVEIMCSRIGNPSGEMYVELQSNNAGNPSGTVLATSCRVPTIFFNVNNGYITFPFDMWPTMVQGTTYWLVLKGTWTNSTANTIMVYYSDAAGYSGQAKRWDGTAWQVDSASRAHAFKAFYLNDPTPTLALPTGYTAFTKAGPPVFNNSAGNFNPYVALDGFVTPLAVDQNSAGLLLGSVGTTGHVVPLDVSSTLPPDPVMLWPSAAASGGTAMLFPVPDGVVANVGTPTVGRYGGGSHYAAQGGSTTNAMAAMPPLYCQFQRLYASNLAGTFTTYFYAMNWLWKGGF